MKWTFWKFKHEWPSRQFEYEWTFCGIYIMVLSEIRIWSAILDVWIWMSLLAVWIWYPSRYLKYTMALSVVWIWMTYLAALIWLPYGQLKYSMTLLTFWIWCPFWKFEYESCWQLKYAMTLLGFRICADLDYECHPSSIFDTMVGTFGHDIIFIGI